MTYAQTIWSALQRVYPIRGAAKLIARDAGVSPAAAELWLSGKTSPSGESLVNLMAKNDALAEDILRFIKQKRQAGK